jgi:hypothetical protein
MAERAEGARHALGEIVAVRVKKETRRSFASNSYKILRSLPIAECLAKVGRALGKFQFHHLVSRLKQQYPLAIDEHSPRGALTPEGSRDYSIPQLENLWQSVRAQRVSAGPPIHILVVIERSLDGGEGLKGEVHPLCQ